MHRSRAHKDINDRERIATAFGELADRGYATIEPWSVCCTSCGWAEVTRRAGFEELPEDYKTVWWHSQSDSLAFVGDPRVIPQTDGFMATVPDDADEADEWLQEHADEVYADEVVARLSEHNRLLSPLYLHWHGSDPEIVAALRAAGLRVQSPSNPNACIVVLPARVEFVVEAQDGAVRLSRSNEPGLLLTATEAKALARKLNAAVRAAVNPMH